VELFLVYPFYAFFDYYFGLPGGFVTLLTLISTIVVLLMFLTRIQVHVYGWLDGFVLLYYFCIIIFPVISFKGIITPEVTSFYFRDTIVNLLLYLVFSRMLYSDIKLSFKYFTLILVPMLIAVIYVSSSLSQFIDRVGGGMVLVISDVVATYFFVNIPKYENRRLLLFIVESAILLYMGSMGTFFSFIIAILLIELANIKEGNILRKIITLSVTAITAIFIFLYVSGHMIEIRAANNFFTKNVNRLINLLVSPSADASFQGRNYFLELGLSVIAEKPLLGEYLYQNRLYASRYGLLNAGYIHNILSVWAEFGILTFVSLLVCFCLITVRIITTRFIREKYLEVAYVSIFCIVNMLLFRTYSWHLLPLILGLNVSMSNEIRNVA